MYLYLVMYLQLSLTHVKFTRLSQLPQNDTVIYVFPALENDLTQCADVDKNTDLSTWRQM